MEYEEAGQLVLGVIAKIKADQNEKHGNDALMTNSYLVGWLTGCLIESFVNVDVAIRIHKNFKTPNQNGKDSLEKGI